MNIKIENLPKYRIAYVRQVGPYGFNNVQVMKKLKNGAEKNNLLADKAIILGISQDNPEQLPLKTVDMMPAMVFNDYCEICVPIK